MPVRNYYYQWYCWDSVCSCELPVAQEINDVHVDRVNYLIYATWQLNLSPSYFLFSFFQAKHKVGFAKLDEALVEVDLMHQKDIDIDKRRLYLFRLLISNNLEYILQAPSENQMHQWCVCVCVVCVCVCVCVCVHVWFHVLLLGYIISEKHLGRVTMKKVGAQTHMHTYVVAANINNSDVWLIGDLLRGDGRIKMSRCSINKKSKHNT